MHNNWNHLATSEELLVFTTWQKKKQVTDSLKHPPTPVFKQVNDHEDGIKFTANYLIGSNFTDSQIPGDRTEQGNISRSCVQSNAQIFI